MKRISLALFLLGFLCLFAFMIIGSEVAADGMLIEPFFLIPLAWLFFLTGGMLAIAHFIKGRIGKK
jgi:prepilin signal peptidase PulO-like enzyme (type II secretory pathway)